MDVEDSKEVVHTDVSVTDAKPAPDPETDAVGITPIQDRSDLMELKAEVPQTLDIPRKGTNHLSKEKLHHAKIFKEEGNSCFKNTKLQEAAAKYIKAMEYLYDDEEWYSPDVEQRKDLLRACQLNLAMCYIKLGKFQEAKDICTNVIEAKSENIVKAWFRRGEANYHLKDFKNAKADFKKTLKLEPNNRAAMNKLFLCQQAVQTEKEKEKRNFCVKEDKIKMAANLESQTSEKNVLFLEGFESVEWMAEKLLGKPMDGITGPNGDPRAQKAWKGFKIDRCAKISECIRKISSGRYKAIVVVDLSYDHKNFEQELGGVLQNFVEAGGAVAFPTSEGLQLAGTLRRLFNTTWEPSSYYRSMWDISTENTDTVAHFFGDVRRIKDLPFSAKVASVKNVPPHEQCFRIKSGAKTQSHVFFMAGREVGEEDVCVAVHKYGSGSVAFFGDVNCEIETAQLAAAYIRKRVDRPLNQET